MIQSKHDLIFRCEREAQLHTTTLYSGEKETKYILISKTTCFVSFAPEYKVVFLHFDFENNPVSVSQRSMPRNDKAFDTLDPNGSPADGNT